MNIHRRIIDLAIAAGEAGGRLFCVGVDEAAWNELEREFAKAMIPADSFERARRAQAEALGEPYTPPEALPMDDMRIMGPKGEVEVFKGPVAHIGIPRRLL